jgi:hypothetical protein
MGTLATLLLVAVFATLAAAYACAVRSATLRRKFESLGVIVGRPMQEIVRHVGEPSRRTTLGTGRELLEWRRINFMVALSFTGGVCDSVDYATAP